MAAFDIVLAVVFAGGLIAGFFRGVVKEVISFAVVLASFVGALYFYPRITTAMNGFFAYPEASSFFGFLTAFITPVLLAGIIIFIVSRFSTSSGLAVSHRLIGCLLGALRGAAIGSVLLVAALAFPLRSHPLDHSRVFPVAVDLIERARTILPSHVSQNIAKEIERMKKETRGKRQEAPVGRKQK